MDREVDKIKEWLSYIETEINLSEIQNELINEWLSVC